MSAMSWFLLLAAGAALVGLSLSATVDDRQQVYATLLHRYNKLARPDGVDEDSPVYVNISYLPISISARGLRDGYLDTVGHLSMSWVDRRFGFYPPDGLSEVRMDVSKIWTPDIELYNPVAPGMQHLLDNRGLAVVSYTGRVTWVPMVAVRSSCFMSPNADATSCILKFGSWAYTGNDIDLRLPGRVVELFEYVENPYLRINSTKAERHVAFYSCCPETPFVSVNFQFNLQGIPN